MKVKWLKDGKEVPRHPRFVKSTNEFEQTLAIKSAELGDAGQYQCIADNTSSKAVLRVKGKTTLLEESHHEICLSCLQLSCGEKKNPLQKFMLSIRIE